MRPLTIETRIQPQKPTNQVLTAQSLASPTLRERTSSSDAVRAVRSRFCVGSLGTREGRVGHEGPSVPTGSASEQAEDHWGSTSHPWFNLDEPYIKHIINISN